MTEWKGSDRRSQPKQQTLKSSVDCCSSTICYIAITRLMSVAVLVQCLAITTVMDVIQTVMTVICLDQCSGVWGLCGLRPN
jgi:hypothetical protein